MPTLKGHLIFGGQGFKSRDVKLYEISETQFNKSKLIASTSSDSGGMFEFYGVNISPKNTYYISASDGLNKLLGLLQSSDTQGLTINDLSTAASAYTFNRFINGEELSGNKPSLRSGWMTYQNLVNPNGTIAQVAINNAATAERLNLLANLNAEAISNPEFRKILLNLTSSIKRPSNRTNLEALISIGQSPANNARQLFELAESAPAIYPADSGSISQRDSWLLYFEHFGAANESESIFFGPGNIAIDSLGDLWVTNNFKPGSKSKPPLPGSTLPRLQPSGELVGGTPLQGGGLYGAGFGIGIDPEGQVWIGNFGFGASDVPLRGNGNSVSLFSKEGEALSPNRSRRAPRKPSGGYTEGELLGVQGVSSDQEGNIWIASFRNTAATPSKIVVYEHGKPKKFDSFQHPELTSPFDIAIDASGDAWVSFRSGGRRGQGGIGHFSFDSKDGIRLIQTIESKDLNVPFGIATASDGSIWVANNGGPPRYKSRTVCKIDPITGEVETFSINASKNSGPWGLNLDGANNVYVANFEDLSISVLNGSSVDSHYGHEPGTALSPEGGYDFDGNIMRPTGLEVDSAGNVWVANNYNKKADLYGQHSVFQAIGLADPVKTPLIGPVAPLLWTTAPQSLI